MLSYQRDGCVDNLIELFCFYVFPLLSLCDDKIMTKAKLRRKGLI